MRWSGKASRHATFPPSLRSPSSLPASMQCHLKFYALVCGAIARAQPRLLEPLGPLVARTSPAPPHAPKWTRSWSSLLDLGADLENNLAVVVHLLHQNQPVTALALVRWMSSGMALDLGWEWQQGVAAHLTAAGSGFAPCWDEVAVMATLLLTNTTRPGAEGSMLGEGRVRGGLMGAAAWCAGRAH